MGIASLTFVPPCDNAILRRGLCLFSRLATTWSLCSSHIFALGKSLIVETGKKLFAEMLNCSLSASASSVAAKRPTAGIFDHSGRFCRAVSGPNTVASHCPSVELSVSNSVANTRSTEERIGR